MTRRAQRAVLLRILVRAYVGTGYLAVARLRGVWSAARPLRRGPVQVDASHPGRDSDSTYRESAKPNPTCNGPDVSTM
jgi:hypothetical protein